jgi:hypothetical protein
MNLENVGNKIGDSVCISEFSSVSVGDSVRISAEESVVDSVWKPVWNSVYDGIKLPIRVERKRG